MIRLYSCMRLLFFMQKSFLNTIRYDLSLKMNEKIEIWTCFGLGMHEPCVSMKPFRLHRIASITTHVLSEYLFNNLKTHFPLLSDPLTTGSPVCIAIFIKSNLQTSTATTTEKNECLCNGIFLDYFNELRCVYAFFSSPLLISSRNRGDDEISALTNEKHVMKHESN